MGKRKNKKPTSRVGNIILPWAETLGVSPSRQAHLRCQNRSPPVLSKANGTDENSVSAASGFFVVVKLSRPTPYILVQAVCLLRAHRQSRVAGLLPLASAGGRNVTKPDYKNLVLLKPSVVEGEGMGSGVARQHGGTVFSIFIRILSAECGEQNTPVL
jgi:hypothetical protein